MIVAAAGRPEDGSTRRFDDQVGREALAPEGDRRAERQARAHQLQRVVQDHARHVAARRPRAIPMPISVVRRATVYASRP